MPGKIADREIRAPGTGPASETGGPPEARKSRWREFAAKLLLALGALQLYNIVAHHQSIVDLSESIKLIAGWWRYGLGELFAFVRIDLEPLQREVLAVVLIFSSAANVAVWREHNVTAVGAAWGLASEIRNKPLPPPKRKFILRTFLFVWVYLGALAYCFKDHMIAFSLLLIIWGWTTKEIAFPSRGRNSLRYRIVRIIGYPFMLGSVFLILVLRYQKQILKTCSLLFLILAADLFVRYALEPVLPWLAIPAPPPARP